MPTTRPVSSWTSRIASSITSATGSVAALGSLPVDVLMKSAPAAIASSDGAAHVVVGAELAGLEDHLEVRVAARLLHAHDLVVDLRVAAGEERAAVDHHVDLVGAELDGPAHVVELHARAATGRTGSAVATEATLTPVPREPLDRDRDEVRVDADGGDRRDVPVGRDRGGSPSSRAPRPCPGVSAPSSVVRSISGSRARARRASPPS